VGRPWGGGGAPGDAQDGQQGALVAVQCQDLGQKAYPESHQLDAQHQAHDGYQTCSSTGQHRQAGNNKDDQGLLYCTLL